MWKVLNVTCYNCYMLQNSPKAINDVVKAMQ